MSVRASALCRDAVVERVLERHGAPPVPTRRPEKSYVWVSKVPLRLRCPGATKPGGEAAGVWGIVAAVRHSHIRGGGAEVAAAVNARTCGRGRGRRGLMALRGTLGLAVQAPFDTRPDSRTRARAPRARRGSEALGVSASTRRHTQRLPVDAAPHAVQPSTRADTLGDLFAAAARTSVSSAAHIDRARRLQTCKCRDERRTPAMAWSCCTRRHSRPKHRQGCLPEMAIEPHRSPQKPRNPGRKQRRGHRTSCSRGRTWHVARRRLHDVA